MKISIIGLGDMGKFFGELLSKSHTVFGYDINSDIDLENSGIIPMNHLSELKDIAPDILINSVTIDKTISVYNDLIPFLRGDTIICDLASVKTGLESFYKECNKHRFVSLHPMFGPTFGDLDHLSNENLIIIDESVDEGKLFFRELFKGIGLNIFEMSFDKHDRATAYSLSVPFTATMGFVSALTERIYPGTTFKRHLNIAGKLLNEDHSLLSEIMFNPYSIKQIEKISANLTYLIHIIKQKDREEMGKFLGGLSKKVDELEIGEKRVDDDSFPKSDLYESMILSMFNEFRY